MQQQPDTSVGPRSSARPALPTSPRTIAPNKKDIARPRWRIKARLLTLLVFTGLIVTACGPAPAPSQQLMIEQPATVGGVIPAQTQPGWDRKIIRTGSINLMVENVEDNIAAVRSIATQAQGLVFSSSTRFEGAQMVATVTIQVPVAAFDDVMSRLRTLGTKVLSENTTSEDVTEEYTDLNSQLKNLQVQEEQLRLLMERATNVDETLTVQRELGRVRGEIEKVQGRLNYLSRRTELSTITVNLAPGALIPTSEGWQPASTAERAWNASLVTLTRLADFVIAVVVYSWWLIPFLLLGVWMFRGWLRARRPRPTG